MEQRHLWFCVLRFIYFVFAHLASVSQQEKLKTNSCSPRIHRSKPSRRPRSVGLVRSGEGDRQKEN